MNSEKPKPVEVPLPTPVPAILPDVEKAVLRFSSMTYHGNVPDYEKHGLPEYGEPVAHVDIAAEPAATAVYLQRGDLAGLDRPSVVLERQTDRWAVFVSSQAGVDNEVYLYILDDGRIFVATDGIVPKNLHFCGPDESPPDPLPPDKS